MVLFLLLDGARLIYLDHFVGNAARDGSRYAMVRGSSWSGTSCAAATTAMCAATSANVKSFVIYASPKVTSTAPLSVTASWPGTNAAGKACDASSGANSPACVVKVNVTYAFVPMIPFLSHKGLLLSSTSEITILQ